MHGATLKTGMAATLAMIVEAAASGKAAPSSADISEGIPCPREYATRFVLALEANGTIRVERRGNNARRFTVVATGQSTDWSASKWNRRIGPTLDCLTCGREFVAESRFNRICVPCKGSPVFLAAENLGSTGRHVGSQRR